MVNFAEIIRMGTRKVVEQIPRLREEARLRYLTDPTAYRREKYSCVCSVDTRVGVFLDSPLCYVHHPERVDLDPQYRDVDPPASWINEHFGSTTMADCFKENQ